MMMFKIIPFMVYSVYQPIQTYCTLTKSGQLGGGYKERGTEGHQKFSIFLECRQGVIRRHIDSVNAKDNNVIAVQENGEACEWLFDDNNSKIVQPHLKNRQLGNLKSHDFRTDSKVKSIAIKNKVTSLQVLHVGKQYYVLHLIIYIKITDN